MLTTDVRGREMFTGLTVEESAEFFALTRRETLEAVRQSAAERDRYLALNAKAQAAKFEMISAEIALDHSKPIRNQYPGPGTDVGRPPEAGASPAGSFDRRS